MTTQPHRVGDVDLPVDALLSPSSTALTRAIWRNTAASATADVTDVAALRDILVDLINPNSRPVLHAQPVDTPPSRDRHAIDVVDGNGTVERVGVHNQPRKQGQVA